MGSMVNERSDWAAEITGIPAARIVFSSTNGRGSDLYFGNLVSAERRSWRNAFLGGDTPRKCFRADRIARWGIWLRTWIHRRDGGWTALV